MRYPTQPNRAPEVILPPPPSSPRGVQLSLPAAMPEEEGQVRGAAPRGVRAVANHNGVTTGLGDHGGLSNHDGLRAGGTLAHVEAVMGSLGESMRMRHESTAPMPTPRRASTARTSDSSVFALPASRPSLDAAAARGDALLAAERANTRARRISSFPKPLSDATTAESAKLSAEGALAAPAVPREARSSGFAPLGAVARDFAESQPEDASLHVGVRNALVTCLKLQANETFVLVAQRRHEPLAGMFVREAQRLGAHVVAFLVDRARAHNEAFVHRLTSELRKADASILLASGNELPATMRRRVIEAGGPRRRHAHMVGITDRTMRQSMRTDYADVHRLGERVLRELRSESFIRVQNDLGTDLRIQGHRRHRWHNESGVLNGPGWTNLPAGEVSTTPEEVEGVVVLEGGMWFPDGSLVQRPRRIELHFERSRLTRVEGLDLDDVRALLDGLDVCPDGRRVGQVAFGTNTGVLASSGDLLQDLKMPGVNLTLGNTLADLTGASWASPVELPILVRRADVSVDGRMLMQRGRYRSQLLA